MKRMPGTSVVPGGPNLRFRQFTLRQLMAPRPVPRWEFQHAKRKQWTHYAVGSRRGAGPRSFSNCLSELGSFFRIESI